MANSTRQVVEEMFRLGKLGDATGVLALLDEQIVVYEPPFLPYGGTYVGHDAFLKLFAMLQEQYFDDLRMQVQYIAVEGEHAIVINHVPGLCGETVILAEELLVRDEKIVEVRIYMHNPPTTALNRLRVPTSDVGLSPPLNSI